MYSKYNPRTNAFEDSNEESWLPQIMWHITDKCYLNCKTCFAKKQEKISKEMSQNQVRENILCLKHLGVQKIDISGGEPLLYTHLPFLVREAISNGLYVTITTRGIGLKENYDWLCNNWSLFSRLIVSLDGGSDEICDFYSSFKDTMKHVSKLCSDLRKKGCNNLRINTVVNKLIIPSENLDEMLVRIMEISPKEWCLIQPHQLNKKREYDDFAVDEEEYSHFCLRVNERWKNENTQIIYRNNAMYSTYWVLQNVNIITRLSNGQEYDYESVLTYDTISSIKSYINKSIQRLPI
ncbi:MAG: radical SAM protein [Lachnospiraceae bacterium]